MWCDRLIRLKPGLELTCEPILTPVDQAHGVLNRWTTPVSQLCIPVSQFHGCDAFQGLAFRLISGTAKIQFFPTKEHINELQHAECEYPVSNRL